MNKILTIETAPPITAPSETIQKQPEINQQLLKSFKDTFNEIKEKAFKFANLMTKYRYRDPEKYMYTHDWVIETDKPCGFEYKGYDSVTVIYNICGDLASIDIPFSVLQMKYEDFEKMCIKYKEKQDKQKAEDDKKKEEKEFQEYLKLKEKFSKSQYI